jgi:catechol 2,3-dioxygenase-like lactoylglutathione lyase family enzyme
MTPPLIDHVGVLVADLEAAIERWSKVLGYSFTEILHYRTDAYVDSGIPAPHHHDARIAFSLEGPPFIELMEFTGEGTHAPAQGEGFHHLGFMVDDAAAHRDQLAALGVGSDGASLDPDGRPILWFTERRDLHHMRLEFVGQGQQPVYDASGALARRAEPDSGGGS